MSTARPALADADRVVIKLGIRVLTHDDGPGKKSFTHRRLEP